MFALCVYCVDETISVESVTLFETEAAARDAGFAKCEVDADETTTDEWGRVVDEDSGDPLFEVVAVSES